MKNRIYFRKFLYIFIFLGIIISLSACSIDNDKTNNIPPTEDPSTNEPETPLPEDPSTEEPEKPSEEPEIPVEDPSTTDPSLPPAEEPETPIVNEKITLSFTGYYQELNGVLDTYLKQPNYLKREQVNYIEVAKKEETKINRLKKLIERLST